MTICQNIEAKPDKIDDAYQEELYELIQQVAQRRQPMKKLTLMHKLRSVQIDGSLDLAVNLDKYTLPAIHD